MWWSMKHTIWILGVSFCLLFGHSLAQASQPLEVPSAEPSNTNVEHVLSQLRRAFPNRSDAEIVGTLRVYVCVDVDAKSTGVEWLRKRLERAIVQKAAVTAIGQSYHGGVGYDYGCEQSGGPGRTRRPQRPAVLEDILGTDFFAEVVSATIGSDTAMAHLEHLAHVKRLLLSGVGPVGMSNGPAIALVVDGRMVSTAGRSADETKDAVSDAGLRHVAGLAELEYLAFSAGHPHVTDASAEYIGKCRQLETLDLSGTRITDVGLRQLRGLSRLRKLKLSGTKINDAAILHLARLSSLEVLTLQSTHITNEGMQKLRLALPNCKVKSMGM
jgi:hypothetical protein